MILKKVKINGWGKTKPAKVQFAKPSNAKEIKQIVSQSSKYSILSRGLGRSYGDASQLDQGTIFDLDSFNEIVLDKDKCEVTAGAGISFAEILDFLIPLGFFLPVVPGTKFITLGGAIAFDVHGKNHHKDGSFGNFLKNLVIIDGSSIIHQLGPDRNYSKDQSDMFWATVGGLGLTGVILKATFKVMRLETSLMKVDTLRFQDIDSLMESMREIDKNYQYSVAWIDTLNFKSRGILTCANHALIKDIEDNSKTNYLKFKSRSFLSVPSIFDLNLINNFTVRVFNEIWFRKSSYKRKNELQSISKFFHPLDNISNWNKLYGKNGFYQYQFVIPEDSSYVIKKIIKELKDNKICSFLGVLKRLGSNNKGMLSFPKKGWTFSLDIPASSSGILEIFEKFDSYIAASGGRIYLAKDARQSPEQFKKTYPNFEKWKKIKLKMDKNNIFSSDMSQRLKFFS